MFWKQIDFHQIFIVTIFQIKYFKMYFVFNIEQAGGSSGLLMDLAANEKDVHADFFNGIISII